MMKVEILDKDIFFGIVPANVESYLSSNNWQQQRRLPNDIAIWFKRSENGDIHRLWLPLDYQLADFAEVMKRAISVIAQEENRSQLQILEDFNTIAIGDIIRLNTLDEFNHGSSSLPLSDGLSLIEQGKNLTTAAAMSEVQAREVHPSRYARVVGEYIENMRLGQTEHGSYIVKLVSPIGEIVEDETPTLPDTPPKLPFGRRAVIRLVKGLEAIHDVASETHRRGRFHLQPFLEMVPQGVSANLCESVVNRMEPGKYKPLEISVTWSYALSSPDQTKKTDISFPVEHMGYIEEAARQFRERNPEERGVNGYVKVLSRDKGETSGTISLVAMIDKRPRIVRIELEGGDYQTAIRAHENELVASAEGSLIQRGHIYWLQNPRNFRVIENRPLPF